jgi:LemA protein
MAMRLFKYCVVIIALLLSGCGINNIPSYDEQVKANWS